MRKIFHKSVIAGLTRNPMNTVKHLLTISRGLRVKPAMTDLWVLFWVLLFASCNTTKYIPQGEYLLDRVDIQMDDKGADKAVLLPYVQQNAIASKLGLGIYNLVNNDSNFIKKFIRKIGEPPVIFNNNLVNFSVDELSTKMRNLGYLNSTVSAQVDTTGKKAQVIYSIHNDEPYRIRNYTSVLSQLRIRQRQGDRLMNRRDSIRQNNRRDSISIRRDSIGEPQTRRFNWIRRNPQLIKEGSVFDLDVLEKERIRVSAQLRNMGYYTFTEENLHYLADTTLRSNQVDLQMVLADSTVHNVPYTVKRINVYSGYDPLAKDDYKIVDSLEYKGIHIYYDSLHFLRSGVIAEKVMVLPDTLFRERLGESTLSLFQALNCMGRVDLQYAENNYPDSTLLDCNIYLTPGNNHSLQAGVEGTNKAGDIGMALDVSYGNLNIFNGSELFNLHLRGAYEFVSGSSGNEALTHNYYEFGISPSLTYPKLHLPFIGSYMASKFNSQTQYSLSYNAQRRPEYIRNFFNFNWKVNWSSQRSPLSQSLSLLDINYVNMPWKSDKFQYYLNNDVDSLTKFSYANVFTAGIQYHLIYTNANVGRIRQNLYTIRFNAESSGNALGWIMDASNAKKSASGQYDIFGNPFAQYVKGEIDYAETFQLTSSAGLAFHAGVGVAFPYKNSSILPFEKRYYGGGPNNVRGWSTRYLGPGSYNQGRAGDPTTHVGDINLILSAEYRFRLLSWLEPAVFVDAGNIWTIKDYPNQPGGLFQWNQFYKEIALGAGIGLRFDLSFLILRLDAGTRIHDPARAEGDRFALFKGNFFKNSAAYVAIGYPF
jgi:outer membrane protein assembly factor BamA